MSIAKRQDIRPTWENPKWQFGSGYEPLTTELFRLPPIPAKGNKSPRPVYEAVGEVLSTWNETEHRLVLLYGILIQSQTLAAYRSLAALLSLNSRLDVIDAAAEQCFQGGFQPILKQLRAHIRVVKIASSRRNEIAHGTVERINGWGWGVLPYMFHPRKTPIGGPNPLNWRYRYTAAQLNDFTMLFDTLHKATFNLTTDVDDEIQRKFPATRKPQHPLRQNKSSLRTNTGTESPSSS